LANALLKKIFVSALIAAIAIPGIVALRYAFPPIQAVAVGKIALSDKTMDLLVRPAVSAKDAYLISDDKALLLQADNTNSSPDVVVNADDLFYRSELKFPHRARISGMADSSWQDLACRYYDAPGKGDLIAANNPTIRPNELINGVVVTIPSPDNTASISEAILTGKINTTPSDNLLSPTGKLNVTAQEFDLFVRVIAAECGANWDYKGVRMVAESIVNRARKTHKNLYDVIMQPGQYSVIASRAYLISKPSALHRQAAVDSLYGNNFLPADVEFFCTKKAYDDTDWFHNLKIFDVYDNTVFMSVDKTVAPAAKNAPSDND
jgi:hypothetical protein